MGAILQRLILTPFFEALGTILIISWQSEDMAEQAAVSDDRIVKMFGDEATDVTSAGVAASVIGNKEHPEYQAEGGMKAQTEYRLHSSGQYESWESDDPIYRMPLTRETNTQQLQR